MPRTIIIVCLVFFAFCLCPGDKLQAAMMPMNEQPGSRQAGGDPYAGIARELSDSADRLTNPKIAIMPFSYADKQKPEVGMMVSERLTTRIVKLRKFTVIERELLEKVMQELNFQGTGAVDAETTKKLGKILGVEAIVTGTVLDLGNNTAEINARLIQTDTAEIIATSSAEIARTWTAPPPPPQYYPYQAEQSSPAGERVRRLRK